MAIGDSYFVRRGGRFVFYPNKDSRGYPVSRAEKDRFVKWFQLVGLAFATVGGPGGALLLVFFKPNFLPFGIFIGIFLGLGYIYQARWVNRFVSGREATEPERDFRAWLWTEFLATPSWFYVAITAFFFALAIATGALAYAMISLGGDWTLFPASCLSLVFANLYLAWTLFVWERKRESNEKFDG